MEQIKIAQGIPLLEAERIARERYRRVRYMESRVPSDDSSDVSALHQVLIDKLKSEGHIRTPRVEAAFRAVPRHLFLPGVALDEVYRDKVIIIKRLNGLPASTSSQPAAMAIMLEQLQLEPGHRILEIGAGSGYNAALMAHIVGNTGHVITVDIDEDLVEGAREHLAGAGFGQVQVVCSDGGFGYPSVAPYDRIILTVGAWDIAPAWREQLKPGGRLLLPLSIRGVQRTVAFEHADSHLASVSISGCSFMMLRGVFAGPEGDVQLGPEPGLYLSVDDHSLIDAEATYKLLTGPRRDWPTTVRVTPREIWEKLSLWLASREPGFCSLSVEGGSAERGLVPYLFGLTGKFCGAVGLLEETSMCMLMCPPDQSPSLEQPDDSLPFELFVRSFGPDDTLAHRLIDQITAWDTAGRLSTKSLRIRAYPKDVAYIPSANKSVVVKRWTRLVLDWLSAPEWDC